MSFMYTFIGVGMGLLYARFALSRGWPPEMFGLGLVVIAGALWMLIAAGLGLWWMMLPAVPITALALAAIAVETYFQRRG